MNCQLTAPKAHLDSKEEIVDFVGEAIREMRIRTFSVGRIFRAGDWTVPGVDSQRPVAYYVLRGRAEISFEDEQTKVLESGDLLVIFRPRQHLLRGLKMALEPAELAGETTLIFAAVDARLASDCPFGSGLPSCFHFPSCERAESPYLEIQLQCLVWETRAEEPASRLMQSSLWEIVFMQALRGYLAKRTINRGWLAAIGDNQLAKVLSAIHKTPEKNWTVEKLAATASVSRATLDRRFKSVLGITPMDYLYKHRMRIAAAMLAEQTTTISTVASCIGYTSESSFSTAFYRRYNLWPGEYRKQAISDPKTELSVDPHQRESG